MRPRRSCFKHNLQSSAFIFKFAPPHLQLLVFCRATRTHWSVESLRCSERNRQTSSTRLLLSSPLQRHRLWRIKTWPCIFTTPSFDPWQQLACGRALRGRIARHWNNFESSKLRTNACNVCSIFLVDGLCFAEALRQNIWTVRSTLEVALPSA